MSTIRRLLNLDSMFQHAITQSDAWREEQEGSMVQNATKTRCCHTVIHSLDFMRFFLISSEISFLGRFPKSVCLYSKLQIISKVGQSCVLLRLLFRIFLLLDIWEGYVKC